MRGLSQLRDRLGRTRDETGVAMVVTAIVMLLMILIPLIVVDTALGELPLARRYQDHESALHSAEAGVDDYINHLNVDPNYWIYNATNPPPDGNQAFNTWVSVPGPATNEGFRYTPDTTTTASTGTVYLTSSGKANNVVRTVKVGVRKKGFLDYLYLTDYEIVDPALGYPWCQPLHAWEGNGFGGYGPDPNNCAIIYFTNQAVLNGPVHTNDGLYICGSPTFNGQVDTYYNSPTANGAAPSTQFGGPGTWLNPRSCVDTPQFTARSGDPASGPKLDLPPGNSTIRDQADYTRGGTGCLYTGPTTITLKVSGGAGRMDVSSPLSRRTESPGRGLCGPGTNLAIPPNGVVYVQTVPANPADPNYSSCWSNCQGDASVSGTLAGQLTTAADNNVIIVGNTVYNTFPGGNDILGLVAVNSVAISHPSGSGPGDPGALSNPTVDAAILSLNHSFYVQNWSTGRPLGKLTVNGVIAQKFRGPVGTFDSSTNPPTPISGYDKNYSYDSRLRYLTPPYFLNPVQSAWGKISYGELKPAF